MATSNWGKDDRTYLQLKALIHSKSIKTIANWQYFEQTGGVLCQSKSITFKTSHYPRWALLIIINNNNNNNYS